MIRNEPIIYLQRKLLTANEITKKKLTAITVAKYLFIIPILNRLDLFLCYLDFFAVYACVSLSLLPRPVVVVQIINKKGWHE